MNGLKRFIEERLPVGAALRKFLREPQPDNVSWAHTFGSALLFVLILQVLTGGLLLLFYAPSPASAWESVDYLIANFTSAKLARSLHVWGASLLIVLATAHILRVTIHGAYKRPREINWLSGLAAFFLVLGFAFTGYLLPWDQKGYWGTEVGTQMIAKAPLLGPWLARLLRGGEEIGAYTLSRFFALHVFFLPALLVAMVGLHLYLLRRHKIAPDPEPEKRSGRTFPFYPHQMFRDSAVALGILAALLLLSLLSPAGLEMKADPSDTSYDPRPEWYFLAHYELLRLFGALEILPIAVIPTLIVLLLLALPFLDRSEHRHWMSRKPAVLAVAALFALMYGAVLYSKVNHPAGGVAAAEESLPLPEGGDPEQMLRARHLFVVHKCVNCHKLKGEGGLQGPDLSQSGWKLSEQHIRRQILNPKADKPDSKMPSFDGVLSEQEVEDLVQYLSQML